MNQLFRELSNAIQVAMDTQNREALDRVDGAVGEALANGDINLPEAGELTADIEIGIAQLNQGDDYLDEVFAAIAQGL